MFILSKNSHWRCNYFEFLRLNDLSVGFFLWRLQYTVRNDASALRVPVRPKKSELSENISYVYKVYAVLK